MTTETATVETTETPEEESTIEIATDRVDAGSNLLEENQSTTSLLDLTEQQAEAEEPTIPASVEKYVVDGEVDVQKLQKGYDELSSKMRSTRPSAPATPEEYEFEFPEGVNMDEDATTGFKKEAHEKGLSQEQYEWVMGEYFNVVQTSSESTVESAETSLKEVWDDNYDANLESAQLAWKTYGKGLDEKAIGNNPVALQILAQVGDMLKEDGLTGNVQTSTVDTGLSDEEMSALQNHPNYHSSMQIQDKFAGELGRRRKLGLPQYRPA